MSSSWLIIGISGVSCSGKSTLAKAICHQIITNKSNLANTKSRIIGDVRIIHQDSYFYPIDSPHHVWVPDLNHINREHLGALNTSQLLADIQGVVSRSNGHHHQQPSSSAADQQKVDDDAPLNILIVEGHLIFNHPAINACFDLRFWLQIPFDVCRKRRQGRVYPQPTPAGYFERYVWPLYQVHIAQFTEANTGGGTLHVLNGVDDLHGCLDNAIQTIWATATLRSHSDRIME